MQSDLIVYPLYCIVLGFGAQVRWFELEERPQEIEPLLFTNMVSCLEAGGPHEQKTPSDFAPVNQEHTVIFNWSGFGLTNLSQLLKCNHKLVHHTAMSLVYERMSGSLHISLNIR